MKKLQLLPIETERAISLSPKENIINSDYYSIYSEDTEIILIEKDSSQFNQEPKLSSLTTFNQSRNLNEYYKMIKLKTYSDKENLNKNNLIEYNVKATDNRITISLETKDKVFNK